MSMMRTTLLALYRVHLLLGAAYASQDTQLNFCDDREASLSQSASGGLLDPSSMACKEMLQFWYLSKNTSLAEYRQMYSTLGEGHNHEHQMPNVNYLVSRAAALIQAQAHMLSAIIMEKPQCMTEQIKTDGEKRYEIASPLWGVFRRQVWYSHDLPHHFQEYIKASSSFLLETIALTEMELDTIRGLLQQWDEDNIPPDTRYYSHEHDGRYSALEYLRRYTFDSMQDIDKGILRYTVRNLFKRGATIADFGSGTGQWAEWLNNTGYVTALAYDGVPDVDIITSGQVIRVDLAAEHIELGYTFNWGLALNVFDTVSTDLAARMIGNITDGVILSWAGMAESASAPSPMDSAAVVGTVEGNSSDTLRYNPTLTDKLRGRAQSDYLRRWLYVFDKV